MTYLTRSTRVTRLAASLTKPIEAGSCRGWRRKHGGASRPAWSRRHLDRQGAALNAPAEVGGHGSAHCDDCEPGDTRGSDARTEAAERATANAVVHSGPAAASNCDAVSDSVRHMDELPEDAFLRAYGLRWAREFRGYVFVACILGDDLHFARIHGRFARAIARPWGSRCAGPEQPDTWRCGAARAHAASLDALDGSGRNDLALAVQPLVWTDQLLDARGWPLPRSHAGRSGTCALAHHSRHELVVVSLRDGDRHGSDSVHPERALRSGLDRRRQLACQASLRHVAASDPHAREHSPYARHPVPDAHYPADRAHGRRTSGSHHHVKLRSLSRNGPGGQHRTDRGILDRDSVGEHRAGRAL